MKSQRSSQQCNCKIYHACKRYPIIISWHVNERSIDSTPFGNSQNNFNQKHSIIVKLKIEATAASNFCFFFCYKYLPLYTLIILYIMERFHIFFQIYNFLIIDNLKYRCFFFNKLNLLMTQL